MRDLNLDGEVGIGLVGSGEEGWGGRQWGIVPGRRKDISRDKEVKRV